MWYWQLTAICNANTALAEPGRFDEDFGDDIEVDYDLPRKLNYDLDLLKDFCRKDQKKENLKNKTSGKARSQRNEKYEEAAKLGENILTKF